MNFKNCNRRGGLQFSHVIIILGGRGGEVLIHNTFLKTTAPLLDVERCSLAGPPGKRDCFS